MHRKVLSINDGAPRKNRDKGARSRPNKPRQKHGHEAILEAAIGKDLELLMPDGRSIVGKLLSHDKYTLTLEKSGVDEEGNSFSVNATIFKSALNGFVVLDENTDG